MDSPIVDIPYYYSYYTNGKEISLLSPKLHGDKYRYNPGDRYPNEKNVAPAGWEQKLQSVSYHTELPPEYPVQDAFGPIYSEQACRRIQSLKNAYCKVDNEKSCHKDMDDESLKRIHDEALRCRNIRALESNSFCSTKKNDTSIWFDPNEPGHIDQVNKLSNKAIQCLDIYTQDHKHLPGQNYILRPIQKQKVCKCLSNGNECKKCRKKYMNLRASSHKRTSSRKYKRRSTSKRNTVRQRKKSTSK